MKVTFDLDLDVNAPYVRFKRADVARTLEVEENLFINVDELGETLGLEFVNADDFLPFLRRHSGNLVVPDHIGNSLGVLFSAAD